ncbi:hypothetical protein BDZ89DRAFT_1071821 [Hymenopellis radicata]|nr:hypothetical protein BDZ89DRAFT_1071821 [Hymenopellis radicata]
MASAAVLSPSPSAPDYIHRLSSTSSSARSSSAGSYRTAPLGTSSSSSSLHTLEAPSANSAHPIGDSRKSVQMEAGPVPGSVTVLNNISPTVSSVVKDAVSDVKHGPPPFSPPASVK